MWLQLQFRFIEGGAAPNATLSAVALVPVREADETLVREGRSVQSQ
jgi:hypothetical protein